MREYALAGQMLADHGQKSTVIKADNIDIAVVAFRIGGDDHRRGKMIAETPAQTARLTLPGRPETADFLKKPR